MDADYRGDPQEPPETPIVPTVSLIDWDVDPDKLFDTLLNMDFKWTTALRETRTTR
jgi:hypothetical protein